MSANKLLQAASGGAGESVYVEDVFSTYLYEGNGSTQTITNGIDLSGEGGLVWIKDRSSASNQHSLNDTERGATKLLKSNSTDAEGTSDLTAFNSNGFDVRYQQTGYINESGGDLVSWTFRKQAGFFDVVTYTGNGSNQAIAHNLGSKPGCVIIKETSSSGWNWIVFHRRLGASQSYDPEFYLRLNTNVPEQWGLGSYVYQEFDSENIYLRSQGNVNGSGNSYVAYLFAHDDQSFGDNSNESIIKCGSYTGSSTLPYTVNLGFEPQWLMIKRTDSGSADDWMIVDVMRGQAYSDLHILEPNNTDAENATTWNCVPTANGFQVNTNVGQFNGNGATYIYVAIRRPMKTPEAGTDVFAIDQWEGATTLPTAKSGFPVDMAIWKDIDGSDGYAADRMRGRVILRTNTTDAETSSSSYGFDYMNGYLDVASNDTTRYSWMFKRATGFFDVVAYTGTEVSGRTISHNLGVIPELIICKGRNQSGTDWTTYDSASGATKYMQLNSSAAAATYTAMWNDTAPTASVFTVGDSATTNGPSNYNYVAYLFATLAGVSKVGSYTGTGSSQNIDCGFSSGARFILIKRTDSTGDWWLWDSARGITSGNDPFIQLNNTSAQVTGTNYINALSSGFVLDPNGTGATGLNASGGSYIFLAIA